MPESTRNSQQPQKEQPADSRSDGLDTRLREPVHGRKWTMRLIKWGLCGLVLVFVVQKAREIWQQADWTQIEVQPAWLFASAVVYALGWFPSVWFWREMLARMAGRYPLLPVARAYYCGHLGKYVPGKATVLLIRSALLLPWKCPTRAAVLTVTFETLLMMGVGLAIALAMLPQLVPSETVRQWPAALQTVFDNPRLTAATVGVGCLLVIPVLSRVLSWLAIKMTPKDLRGSGGQLAFGAKLLAVGMLWLAMGWSLLGLSLGCAIRGVGGEFSWNAWPHWTGMAALATVIGFVAVFAPGGIGVREGLLMSALQLQGTLAPSQIVLVPVVLRGIWFSSEILTAVVLYFGFGSSARKQEARPPTLT